MPYSVEEKCPSSKATLPIPTSTCTTVSTKSSFFALQFTPRFNAVSAFAAIVLFIYAHYVMETNTLKFRPLSALHSLLSSQPPGPPPLVVHAQWFYKERPHNTISYNTVLKTGSGNYGDCLWELAAQNLVDQSRVRYCRASRESCLKALSEEKGLDGEKSYGGANQGNMDKMKIMHLQPVANDLYEVGRFMGTHGRPERLDSLAESASAAVARGEPFLLVGLGAQGQFNSRPVEQDLGGAAGIRLGPFDYNLDERPRRLLRILQDAGQPALLRGAFTEVVATRAGYSHGFVAGCPTLLLNHDVRLGRTLQSRYDAVARRAGDTSLRVAINARSMARTFSFSVSLLKKYPNALVFAQGPSDLHMLRSRNVSFERVRVYEANVPRWLEELSKMDVSIGPRIHGNMAALAATPPTPAFIVAPDYRVLEMADEMRVPYTDIYDRRLLKADIDVAELVRSASFDGEAFDRNRCRIAKLYKTVFDQAGVPVAKHIDQLTRIC